MRANFDRRWLYVVASLAVLGVLLLLLMPRAAIVSVGSVGSATSEKRQVEGEPVTAAAKSTGQRSATPRAPATSSEFSSLEIAAQHGDLAAAEKLVALSDSCGRVQSYTMLSAPFLGQDTTRMSQKQLEEYELKLKSLQQVMLNYGDFCKAHGEELGAKRREYLRMATELGDVRAGKCFVDATMDLSDLRGNPQLMQSYFDVAHAYIDRRVKAGDWGAVVLMLHAYGLSEYKGRDLKASLVMPDDAGTYRYAKLLSLGTPAGEPIVSDAMVRQFQSHLTPEQVAEGDDWANAMFSKYFQQAPGYAGGEIGCN